MRIIIGVFITLMIFIGTTLLSAYLDGKLSMRIGDNAFYPIMLVVFAGALTMLFVIVKTFKI